MTKPVVNIADLPMRAIGKGSRYGGSAGRVGAVVGMEMLGAQYIVVPPGKAAYPRHNHRNNEEMFVILEGAGEYQLGDEVWPVRAGDVIAAPAGDATTAHQLRNTSTSELRYLAVSTRHDPDVFEYPDSGKFGIAAGVPRGGSLQAASLFYIGRKDSAVDYWDGEETGEDK